MMSIDETLFCRAISAPMSHTTDAMTAPTPACIPDSTRLTTALSRNS